MAGRPVPLRPHGPPFEEVEGPIGLDEYQQFTTRTDRSDRPGAEGLGFVLLGLFGEVGSLLSALKKKQREKDAYVAYHDAVLEELGDSLWYFANATLRADLPLSIIAQRTPAPLDYWDYQGRPGPISFADLQRTDRPFSGPIASDAVEHRLLVLAGKVGHLMENWSSRRSMGKADLVQIFRALIAAADDAEVSLEEAARGNVVKTLGRWPDKPAWGPKRRRTGSWPAPAMRARAQTKRAKSPFQNSSASRGQRQTRRQGNWAGSKIKVFSQTRVSACPAFLEFVLPQGFPPARYSP